MRIRVKFGVLGGEKGVVNTLALEKTTYQILASFYSYNPSKSLCGGGWMGVGRLVYSSVQL